MSKQGCIFPIIVTIIILAVGATGAVFLNHYFNQYEVTKASALVKSPSDQTADNQNNNPSLKEIIKHNQKRVMQVMVHSGDKVLQGSGFLYNGKGDMITNAHVVSGAKTVTVKTANSKTYTGEVIGVGDTIDVAVIHIPELADKSPMKIASKHEAEIGDKVIALGSPLGLQNTVTTGIISGINRDFSLGRFSYQNVYQISAPITHGNSGGPLLDQETGKVLAINSAGFEGKSIGFSIPISDVIDKVQSWSKNPEAVAGYNGSLSTAAGSSLEQVSKSNARRLVHLFYQKVDSEDYVKAYALLGSEWQKDLPYQKFRTGYLRTLSNTIKQMKSTTSSDHRTVTVTIILEAKERTESYATQISLYKGSYKIGYENGKLKLLSGTFEKLD